jgi:hypothetical protein
LFPIAAYRLASEKRFSVPRSGLHKNHPAKIMVFCRGGNKNGGYAYKTIDLYAANDYDARL